MKLAVLIGIAMVAIMAFSIIPAYAFVVGPNPNTEDNKWEMYGPHVQGIICTIYDSTTTEWNDMNVGLIDITDWALDATHLTLWNVANGPIVVPNYGGDNGYFLLDINNAPTYGPADPPSTWVHNPTSELPLREAIAYACNHTYISQFSEGLDLPIYTPMPLYMAGYVESTIYPGAGNQSYTWSNLNPGSVAGNCDIAAANAILNAAGYTIDGSGWRIDPVSQGGTGAELNLIFYSRGGDRGTIGDDINTNLNTYLHIKTTYQGHVPRSTVTGPVFAQEYFNLYTGGWTGIGPDPDYVCDLYNGSNYYHPGSPENYGDVNYPWTNANATMVKLGTDPTDANETRDVKNFQLAYAYYVAGVPLYSTSGYKAYKVVPSETSHSMASVTPPLGAGDWMDLVNQPSVGANSWWSTLDMCTYGNLYPALNVSYGFSSSISLQNIVYAQWFWDLEVLGRIYDGGWARNPLTLEYSPTIGVPQLFENYSVGTWYDSAAAQTKTAVTVYLRPGMYWQDGYPITAADVNYSFTEISTQLLNEGLPPPWWYPTVQYFRSVELIDPYTIEVLLDINSIWAAGWVAGSLVIPEHIWEPLVTESTVLNPVVQGTTPDPNIIGSGPFRWVSGLGSGVGTDITVTMAANTPGSVVRGITSPGYYLYYPVYTQVVQTSPVNTYGEPNYAVPGSNGYVNVTWNVILRNLFVWGPLSGTLTITVLEFSPWPPGPVITAYSSGPIATGNLSTASPYPMGSSATYSVTVNCTKKELYVVIVTFHIEDPPGWFINGIFVPNPWISDTITWVHYTWCTLLVDIGGTDMYTVMNDTGTLNGGVGIGSIPTYLKNDAPAPDLTVNIKDISIAAKAFGTIPGQPGWSSIADVNHDYKIDIRDISLIAKQFGF